MVKKTSKTPAYSRLASKNYHKKVLKKQVVINPEKLPELYEKVKNEKNFSGLIKQLLINHYNI